MWALIVAAVCAGLFAGAAIYINAVEHPARLSCGNDVALREFAPSYRRAPLLADPQRADVSSRVGRCPARVNARVSSSPFS
jgi:hypothetical protein